MVQQTTKPWSFKSRYVGSVYLQVSNWLIFNEERNYSLANWKSQKANILEFFQVFL